MFALSLVLSLLACETPPAPPAGLDGSMPIPDGGMAMPDGAMPAHVEPAAAAVAPDASGWSHFGSEFTTQETLAASSFLADPAPFVGKTVRVEGRVAEVCQKAGCWMVLADGDKSLRVRMKDHAFSVDKAGEGCTASIEGQVVATPVDPKTVEHYASESKEGATMPENSATNGMVYEIEATGVAMKRG